MHTAKVKGLPGKSTVDISYMRYVSTVMSWLKPYTKVKYSNLNSHALLVRKSDDIWQHVPNSSPRIKRVRSADKFTLKELTIDKTGIHIDNGIKYYRLAYKHKNIGWVNKSAVKLVVYKKVSYGKPKGYQGHIKKTNLNLKLYNHVPNSSFNAKVVAKGLDKKNLLFFDASAIRSDKTKWIRVKVEGKKRKYWILEKDVKYTSLRPTTKSLKSVSPIKPKTSVKR